MPKFVPRQRKHKVLARERDKENARREVTDTNQEIIPADNKEADEKRAQLKKELSQDGVKMNSKKAKRLEKYIDNKLKKDENRELLAKLASRKIDTSLFASSKAIGHGQETKKQALARALREHRAGIDPATSNDEILFETRNELADDVEYSEDDVSKGHTATTLSNSPALSTKSQENPVIEAKETSMRTPSITAGSGLKRPLDVDEEGRPILKKRQKRGGVKSKFSLEAPKPVPEVEEESAESESDEWGGFSDDDGSQHSLDSSNGSGDDDTSDEDDSDDDDDEDDEDEEFDENESEEKTERSSAFKAWAHQQRNEALGFQPTDMSISLFELPKPESFVPRAPEQDPLPMELQTTQRQERTAYSVTIDRAPEIQEARLKLPVVSEEQRLMEFIHNHDIVVVCGATGSGKTTQVPQFLYEAGYGSPDSETPGMIGVTQPRRVAAVSMSKRVGEELGDHGSRVGYQIRFEGSVDPSTAIKFMTDGVLLREIAQDITLRKYCAIIIDEAHERSANTDILIGMLSRIIKLRTEMAQEDKSVKPLKLIIMSATLRVEDMTMNQTLFATPPPVVEVEGRQHPVTMHFSRRTSHDYVDEAFRKITRGHRKLPPGTFLVFLTGRNEIIRLSKRLKAMFGGPKSADGPKVQISASEAPLEVEDLEFGDADDGNLSDGDEILSDDEDDDEFQIEEDQESGPLKMQVLPLYSLLPTKEQMRVFEPAPEGTRQVILATNVAETSLTIPGTRFVFDCGRSKERHYNRLSGVQSYQIGWISKASANQRAGRAGRTGPGHCYRFYSSAVFERDFAQFADPELLRMPIEGVVLQLKAMNLQHVVNFPFPSPPDRQSLAKAEKLLNYLTAIDSNGQITRIGKTMSVFPLSPRFARILLAGNAQNCLHYTIALVAGLSAPDLYMPENQAVPTLVEKDGVAIRTTADVMAEDRRANIKRAFNQVHHNFCFLDDKSDAIKLLQVVCEFAHEPTEKWCDTHFVRFKVLKEIQQLRKQITDLLRSNIPAFANLRFHDKLDPPTDKQISALKQIVATGFIDNVAIRSDYAPVAPEITRKPRNAIDVPYIPLFPIRGEGSLVYIHPSSPLAHISKQECPKYIVYSQLQRSTQSVSETKVPKTRMHALTDSTSFTLAGIAKGTPLLEYSKPIGQIKVSSGDNEGATRECTVKMTLKAENTGGQGWPMGEKKVKQKKLAGKGWVVV